MDEAVHITGYSCTSFNNIYENIEQFFKLDVSNESILLFNILPCLASMSRFPISIVTLMVPVRTISMILRHAFGDNVSWRYEITSGIVNNNAWQLSEFLDAFRHSVATDAASLTSH